MKIKIYVNYGQGIVINEKQFAEELKKKAAEMAEDTDQFCDWLDDDYNSVELFYMTEEEKTAVSKQWAEFCKGWADEELISGCSPEWEEVELEV